MSNYPKRIYVLPARHVAAPQPQRMAPKRALPTEQVVAQLLGDDMGPSGPRKRERLNHLSQEEKMDRRKLKNRVAAQNARDKKKERSAKIEDVMRDLVEENRRLRAENERLRRQNKNLMNQQNESVMYMEENNENLMNSNDACIYQNVVYEEEVVGEVAPVVVVGGEDRRAFESAVGTGPIHLHQQQHQQPTPSYGFQEEQHNQCGYVSNYHLDSMQPHGSQQEDGHLEQILEHLKSPSGEFDRFVAGYIEEGADGYAASCSSGSMYTSSETRETLSPNSLAMSPSMSSSSTDWDDELLGCGTETGTLKLSTKIQST
eukprot:NP_001293600.1 X-box Binding Protein homolog [Caenorhabditis elegans]